jgi:hypothetical protein
MAIAALKVKVMPSTLKTKTELKAYFSQLMYQRDVKVKEIFENGKNAILHNGSLVSCTSFINRNTKYQKSRALLLQDNV